MTFLRALAPALLAALLFAGALPPFGQWWLAWVWMGPLFWKLWSGEQARGLWFGFRQGWLTGFLMFLATVWWVGHVTVPGMLALCVYLALYPAVWGALAARLRPSSPGRGLLSALALALLWAGLEWARGAMPVMGFPWNGAAAPLVEMPGLRALAAWTGVTGLSALPVLFMSGLAVLWLLRGHRNVRGRAVLLCGVLALPAMLTLALWEKSPPSAAQVQVLLVQPNVPRTEPEPLPDPLTDEDVVRLRAEMDAEDDAQRAAAQSLTLAGLAAAQVKPQLIVWPESAVPGDVREVKNMQMFQSLFDAGAQSIISGVDANIPDDAGNQRPGNCAVLLTGDPRNFQLHAKVHLVAFGEYIPLRRQIPLLEKWLGHLIVRDFMPGTSLEPLLAEGLPGEIIPLICFEDTIAPLAAKFVRERPQLIVNLTNDNWFQQSTESAIHTLNARWRCVELRRPMVRASNTGVTCVIDTEGRITDELPRWQPGVLHASVALPPGEVTFYARHGNVFSITAGLVGLALALVLILTRPRP